VRGAESYDIRNALPSIKRSILSAFYRRDGRLHALRPGSKREQAALTRGMYLLAVLKIVSYFC
jgi:hypothetical protein